MFTQQGVIALRPQDQLTVWQNGSEKRLLIQSLLDAVIQMAKDVDEESDGPMLTAMEQNQSDITALFAAIAALPAPGKYVDATTPTPTTYTGLYPARVKATVSGGVASFDLSSVFPTFVDPQSVLLRAEENTVPHAFGIVSYNSTTKILSVPVSRAAAGIKILTIDVLGANIPANGSVIYATVWGK